MPNAFSTHFLWRPNFFPLFFATSIPSRCRLRMVCLSCSAIDANTSTSILVTISMIHSCPSGTSIIVVGRANAISRIHCFWNQCLDHVHDGHVCCQFDPVILLCSRSVFFFRCQFFFKIHINLLSADCMSHVIFYERAFQKLKKSRKTNLSWSTSFLLLQLIFPSAPCL